MNTLHAGICSYVERQERLSAAQRDEMFALLCDHFDGVTREQFEADLAEKTHAILLFSDDRMVGFSTLLAYQAQFRGQTIAVIYSGDTIVSPEAWGSTALPRAWIGAVNEIRTAYAPLRCFWLLLTSGFRTYRFLPVFWREFWPRFGSGENPAVGELLCHLATARFGRQFDPLSGVVRFSRPQRLRDGLAGIPLERMNDPHVRFFATRNPGHAGGDELVCLAELNDDNLTAAGRRMVQASERSRSHC